MAPGSLRSVFGTFYFNPPCEISHSVYCSCRIAIGIKARGSKTPQTFQTRTVPRSVGEPLPTRSAFVSPISPATPLFAATFPPLARPLQNDLNLGVPAPATVGPSTATVAAAFENTAGEGNLRVGVSVGIGGVGPAAAATAGTGAEAPAPAGTGGGGPTASEVPAVPPPASALVEERGGVSATPAGAAASGGGAGAGRQPARGEKAEPPADKRKVSSSCAVAPAVFLF